MLESNVQELEEYDARLLDDSPFVQGTAAPKYESESFQRSADELSASESPFLMEALSETEDRAEEEGERASRSRRTRFRAPRPRSPRAAACDCGDSTSDSVADSDGSEDGEYRQWGSFGEQEKESEGSPIDEYAYAADPYGEIRLALRPEHAWLPPNKLSLVVGRKPALIALHRMLTSPEPRLAVLAVLLGNAGRRSVRLARASVPLPAYLRLLSRLCGEAAEHAEEYSALPENAGEGTREQSFETALAERELPAPGPDGKYTSSPNEVPAKRTTPAARNVITLARQTWPQLTDNGASTLAAQFMHETGGGQNCYNWNLGNVKSQTDVPHMYLKNVWECGTPDQIQGQVDKSNGLVRIPTAVEIKAHGWSCTAPSIVGLFNPPHPASRFRAYSSLEEGAQRWITPHTAILQRHPEYVDQLNAGDCAAVAKTLRTDQYYTGSESVYAQRMKQYKAQIDRQLAA